MILQELFEGRMTDIDIEYQDFLRSRGRNAMTDKQFQDAYGMTRVEWAKKNREWTQQKERRPVTPDAHLFHEESQDDRNARIIAGEIEDAAQQGNEQLVKQKIKELIRVGYTLNKDGKLQRMGMYEENVAEGLKSWIQNKLDPNNIPGFKEVYPEVKSYVIKDIIEKLPKDKFGIPTRQMLMDPAWSSEMGAYDPEIKDSIENYFIQKLGNIEAYKFLNNNKKLTRGMITQLEVDIANALQDIKKNYLQEKQDACYHKVKSRYKVWPSAYASGALVQCRKKGAANWGNKSKK